jgi:hypothetical protein
MHWMHVCGHTIGLPTNQHSLKITQAPANHVSQPNLLDAYLLCNRHGSASCLPDTPSTPQSPDYLASIVNKPTAACLAAVL